ncbi:MAG: hypothetical protein N5P05_003842 [Chroococcopsis gigantea SAG 12.99]|jgi:hypothetical protein|nr:DUF1824 family protein [Chlorogloea purpurea SAG 13.99]MDV3002236.1 hypothetical protein [Chroococcopsis gigantea SAG 12.99]
MTTPNIDSALKLIKEYSCVEPKVLETEQDREELRQAIILITHLSDFLNFGICADNPQQALDTLTHYLRALSYEYEPQFAGETVDSSGIYLKFNTRKMSYYLDAYTGTYRGVLISCQGENEGLVGTYGHFPLNLFISD